MAGNWAAALHSRVAVLSGLSDSLLEKAFYFAASAVQSEISLQLRLEEDLADLRRTQRMISATLSDAEERRVVQDEAVLNWLNSIKQVALDAEDIIDEFETRLNRSSSRSPGETRKRPWLALASPTSSLILFRRRVAAEIKDIKERFDRISEERQRLRIYEGEARRHDALGAEAPPTVAALPFQAPLGRDDDKDEILRLLLPGEEAEDVRENNQTGLLVIPIFGTAGIGKTTLAGQVFNDANVERCFDRNRIWICATKGFDVVRITKEIHECLTGESCSLSNFNLIQCQVRKFLIGKPFLLVLDDVRDDGPGYWDHLRVCLTDGGGGGRGRVVITTRSEDVARNMGTVPGRSGRLNGLSNEHGLELLLRRAFPNGGSDSLPRLQKIGKQIVERCQGSPLAALSLGGLLRNVTDEAEWLCVLKAAAEFPQENHDILPQLNLAYDRLPLLLKRCFTFCAIFPEGYLFDRDVLVRMWIAEGFVERRRVLRLETIGNRYFEELRLRSFFQISDINRRQKTRYIIPSLLREVAESVVRHECFRMVGNTLNPAEAPDNARHTLLLCDGDATGVDFEEFHKYKRLRTFSLKVHDRIGTTKPHVWIRRLPSDLFLKLRYVRVLDLSYCTIKELPDSVGELKLLRYLGLCNTLVERLPESVGTLCNLQTMDLNHCYKLRVLPEDTSKLVNLRYLGLHLDPHKGSNLSSMPPGIGNLTSLETLHRFIVGTGNGLGLSEMKNLSLHGELWISGLENADAQDANLMNKRNLTTLTLQWTGRDRRPTMQQARDSGNLIEHLRPPSTLKNLWVDSYDEDGVPSWLQGDINASLPDLVSLRLSYCKRWKSVQSLGHLPSLKELLIEGMPEVNSIDPPDGDSRPSFPALEKLTMFHFPALRSWHLGEDGMPQLRDLYISHCRMLVDVPRFPVSLKKLAIKGCGELHTITTNLPALKNLELEACHPDILHMVSKFTSLSSLTISQISGLQKMNESLYKDLTALERLEITCCRELLSIADSGSSERSQLLPSLRHLSISSCPKLAFIPRTLLPDQLKDLRLLHCHMLSSIAWDTCNLTSLQHLEIHDLPRIMSLPRKGELPSLQHFCISMCPFLAWRCRKGQGKDWPQVSKAFYVEIDFKTFQLEKQVDRI